MAVYKRTYKRYEGALRPDWARWTVIPSYAFEDLFRSKTITWFYVGSFLGPLVCALLIYLHHNLTALKMLQIDITRLLTIDSAFFYGLLGFQSTLGFFLAAFVGPGLISADVAHNAIPLYLSRPLSRTEYVAGKMSVLVILLSLMTWVPGLLLFLMQSNLAGFDWLRGNARIAGALFAAAWLWMLVISLLALALSAWVKWKPVASALMFGIFFIAAAFGETVNEVLDTRWGNMLNLGGLVGTIWSALFDMRNRRGEPPFFFGMREGEIPLWAACTALAALCAASLYLLSRKVRGAEVVK